MNVFRNIAAALLILNLTSTLVSAQTNQLETDKGIASAIAPYDADVRQAILKASEYPQVLEQLQKSQNKSVESFQKMIHKFRKKKQGWFYTLTRYPDLMHTLATLPNKQSESSIYKLLPNQDPGLQVAAWKLYKEKKNLVLLDNINVKAQQEFENTIQPLNGPAREAFQKLGTMPDVLTLMTNNIDLTIRLGEHYKSNPTQLTQHLSALHDSLEVQNQYEVAAFKKQMADDPQAMNELNQAGNDYANSNGYNSANQNYSGNPYYNNGPNYYGNPYSYWFGYPYWYSSPMWYPGGFGYSSGFYFGTGGYGLYGFPSYGFSNWFFNGGYYRHYPNLYRQFGNYYQGNIGGNRVMGSVNRGFMGAASNHYNAGGGGGRLNTLSSPSSYNRQGGQFQQNNGRRTTHSNANTYHTQSWSGYGGRNNSAGFRGGASRGGGGGGHIGGHSGGGGHGGRH